MDLDLVTLAQVVATAETALRDADGPDAIWTTGFPALDDALGGGLRAGNLCLLAGAQGLGKTTFALQMARAVALAGRQAAYFCFEHDNASLMERLIAMECGFAAGDDAPTVDEVRAIVEGRGQEVGSSLSERLAAHPGGSEALATISLYADRLHLRRSTGQTTTTDVITDTVERIWQQTGEAPIVFVDYLQKVKVEGGRLLEDDRVTEIVERLKDLALDAEVPVVAITASDKGGLESGGRMRAHHLRGSTALAYEADVLFVLADKYDVVARHHLVFDTGAARRFRDWVVLTIEKNRNGVGGIDLEFMKNFEHGHYLPDGSRVGEKLIDERVYTE